MPICVILRSDEESRREEILPPILVFTRKHEGQNDGKRPFRNSPKIIPVGMQITLSDTDTDADGTLDGFLTAETGCRLKSRIHIFNDSLGIGNHDIIRDSFKSGRKRLDGLFGLMGHKHRLGLALRDLDGKIKIIHITFNAFNLGKLKLNQHVHQLTIFFIS